MTRGLWRIVSVVVLSGNAVALLLAAGHDGGQLLTMSGLVAGAMYATRQAEYSVAGVSLALVAAGAVVATGWLALDRNYPLWAWALALLVGLLTPLIPEVADAEEHDFSSLPADREFAEYSRAARFQA